MRANTRSFDSLQFGSTNSTNIEIKKLIFFKISLCISPIEYLYAFDILLNLFLAKLLRLFVYGGDVFCRNKDLSPSINYVISMNCVYLGINATLFLRFSVVIDIMPLHQ